MKKRTYCGFDVLPETEVRDVMGGGIIDTFRCVTGTLSHNFASVTKTVILGGTIWGIARMCGIADECGR